jgi:hypothetical protein
MILSSRGTKNLNDNEKTFVFHVNGQQFYSSTFAAQYISPTISCSLRADPTITDFSIGTPQANECFHYILSLCDGDDIVIDKSLIWRFAMVCRELGNEELISIVLAGEPISPSNMADRLLAMGKDSDFVFVCTHFCSLDHSLLSVDILWRLLNDPRLRIESEDSLFDILENLITHDSAFLPLLNCLEIQYLSVSSISRFISHISIESLNWQLWSSICRRLSLSVFAPISNPRFTISPNSDMKLNRARPFDGVFYYLWTWCRRNPHLAGLIEISAPDQYDRCHFQCYDLITHESKSGKHWATQNTNTVHYVQIDFKDLRLCPSACSVKVHNSTWSGGAFLRSWRFEGSNNGSDWSIVDSHSDSSDLTQNDKEMSFEVSFSSFFRFLRFLMVGPNSSGNYYFSLQALEVFGRLTTKTQQTTRNIVHQPFVTLKSHGKKEFALL